VHVVWFKHCTYIMQLYVSKDAFAALVRLEVQVKLTFLLFGLFSRIDIFNMMVRTPEP
jgi:hypothetical protein